MCQKFNLSVQLFAGEVEQGAVCGGASPRGERTFRARRDEAGTRAGETAVPGGIELEPTRFQTSTSKMELLEERSASRIGDRRDGSNDRPRSRSDLFGTEVVGCVLVGDDGDGGHSGEETKQAQGPGSRIGVAIVNLVSCICVVINAHRRQT